MRAELLRRFHEVDALRSGTRAGRRTVAELFAKSEERAAARRRREAESQAADQARREREQALARAKYLDRLAGREEELWLQVEALVETKRPKEYDRAVHLLEDLRDLSDRQHLSDGFPARLGRLRERCAKRPSLLARLDREGMEA